MKDEVKISSITPGLKLIGLKPPIPGFGEFFGSYLFSGEKKALVEIGPRAVVPGLLDALAQLNISPREIDYIILTHIHLDHAGGVGTIIKEMPQAKVVAHPRAHAHLVAPARLWQASLQTIGDLARQYGELEPVPEDRIIDAIDGMKLDLGRGLIPEIYLTPGHAPHHLSIYDRASRVLLAGEAAGVCVDGRVRPTTPPPFRLEDALASIDRLIALAPQRLCYAHFGCYGDAVARLHSGRAKMLEWRETIGAELKKGLSPEAILAYLEKTDPDLAYLSSLPKDDYGREYALILNTVKGLGEWAKETK